MTLEEIYQQIDKPEFVLEENYSNKVIPLFKAFADEKPAEDHSDDIKIAQAEIDVQNFTITNNKLKAKFSGTTDDGEAFEYPSLKNWGDFEFDYIIGRQKKTKNPALITRYAHLLWLSPKKHIQFAIDALDSYLRIIRSLNSNAWDNEDRLQVLSLKYNISCAFHLAVSTGQATEIEKIKKLILSIVRKFRFENEKTYIHIGLVNLMLSVPKVFKKDDFRRLDSYCLKFALRQGSQPRIDILIAAEKVSLKLGIKTIKYQDLIGVAYEELSKQREDGINIAAIHFCQQAIAHYKKAKNKAKVKELEARYKHLKQTMNLEDVAYEMDITEAVREVKKMATEVLDGPTEEIILYLMYSPIFPSFQHLHDQAMKQKNENSFQFLAGTSIYDEYGHVSAQYQEEDEKIHLSMMQGFDFRIRISSMRLVNEIILGAIENNKLSALLFIRFIRDHSWLGQDITITYRQNEKKTFNWLQTLAPGINDFFRQVDFMNQNPLNVPNYVLAIDSLSLKIEGILRDICELRGTNTFFQSTDPKGRNIVKEMDINALLREETIKKTLHLDDLMLLQFLLVDKAGWNLRNRVAHTLIRKSNAYGPEYILMLLIAILKLSKNEYTPPPEAIPASKNL